MHEILGEMLDELRRGTDQVFFWVLLGQWVFAVVLALVGSHAHLHVEIAVFGGAAVNALPLALIVLRPGWWLTRQCVAVSQMLWSAILLLLSGGRSETQFHVFGSLALLALYRDWTLLPTATLVIGADHLLGNPRVWAAVEHAGWVSAMDLVLAVTIVRATREMRRAARREARLERWNANIEAKVTERTLQLQESSERYRALVENTEAVTFEYDLAAKQLVYVAPQAARLLECTPAQLEDRAFVVAAIHPEDRAQVWEAFYARAGGELPWSDPIDARLVTPSGRTIHVRTFLSVAWGRRVRAVALDITRQRELEIELQQAQKLESVGRLAAGVAHEINTPIQFVGDSVTFMKTSLEDLLGVVAAQRAVVEHVLASDPDDAAARAAIAAAERADLAYIIEEVPEAANRALEGVERVSTIVRSMKVFAHPDGADMTTIDLNAAVASTLTISRNEYRYVADLETDLGDLPPITCYAGEVNQALLNIVVNAAHAMVDAHARTGARGLLSVTTRVADGCAEIAIRDTGGGIPDHVQARIYDPFFTTKGVGKGTGQGLSIARGVIVDRHHGSLRFETHAGVGTTFYIRIPIDGTAIAAAA